MSTPTLDSLVSSGWNDHADDPAGVLARLVAGEGLVTEPKHVAPFAGLVVHVAGEHLGRFADGLDLLNRINRPPLLPESPEGRALARSRAVLEWCGGDREAAKRSALAARSGAHQPFASDLARILAIAASAFAGQGRAAEASAAFDEALTLASYGPTGADPAARALAITANNLASAYEERPSRTPTENALMVRAADAARDFWGLAGTWVEAARAEYRCSASRRAAGDGAGALEHGRRSLRIVEANGDDACERGFAHEAISLAHHAMGDEVSARQARDAMVRALAEVADADSRSFVADSLKALDTALGIQA